MEPSVGDVWPPLPPPLPNPALPPLPPLPPPPVAALEPPPPQPASSSAPIAIVPGGARTRALYLERRGAGIGAVARLCWRRGGVGRSFGFRRWRDHLARP